MCQLEPSVCPTNVTPGGFERLEHVESVFAGLSEETHKVSAKDSREDLIVWGAESLDERKSDTGMIGRDRSEIGGRISRFVEIDAGIVIDPKLWRIVGPLVRFDLGDVSVISLFAGFLPYLGHIEVLFF
jgi:hypothetical protein